ncbi:MAG: LacI family DNA-binding transcriptional regulator [Ilumatobacteraceae bacterium]
MGRQPIPLHEIALRAGVSDATVDRVVHGREGVRVTTAAQVRRAIAELTRQQEEFELGGRTFVIDLVMHTPARFSTAVRQAFEAEVPLLRPAVFKIRPKLFSRGAPEGVAEILRGIAARGSHGVVLKASDEPPIVAAVAHLVAKGIPVITLVTDLPASARLAYVGIDNRAAGATAAYLVGNWLGPGDGTVLLTLSSSRFRGEEEREAGFRALVRSERPDLRIVDLAETEGLDHTISKQVAQVAQRERIDAVYSIGGGNRSLLQALAKAGQHPRVVVAHDLDEENTALLANGKVSAVLHHDLRGDARRICRLLMQAHGAVPGVPRTEYSSVTVVTPHNLPVGEPA